MQIKPSPQRCMTSIKSVQFQSTKRAYITTTTRNLASDGCSNPGNRLAQRIKRKSEEISRYLQQLGEEALEQKLQSPTPLTTPYRLSTLIANNVPEGKATLIFELNRNTLKFNSASQLADLCTAILKSCDVYSYSVAFSVCTDTDDTPEGLNDLFLVRRAANEYGSFVLQQDWFLHPYQLVTAVESGAAGVLGVITSVSCKGTLIMSSYAAALGLDAPIEIVNLQELKQLETASLNAGAEPPVLYGLNISVGLSVTIPGFGSDVAKGLLGELPFGSMTVVGCKSVDEARAARIVGADALLVKSSLLAVHEGDVDGLVNALITATNFDD